jgi:hypothetical protein
MSSRQPSGKPRIDRRAIPALAKLLAIAVLVATSHARASETPWQLDTREEGISIYTRTVEGSPYLAVKATARINAPVTRVSRLIGDVSDCAEWRTMCKSSKVLEAVSEQERYVYMVLDLPWPATDRDLVIHSKTRIDPESRTATVDLRSDSSRHPEQDFVRAETRGQFVIKALGSSEVEFTYIMHTDLGGGLPARSVNSRLTDSAFDDLNRLIELAEG